MTVKDFLKNNSDLAYTFTPNKEERVQLKIYLGWDDKRHDELARLLKTNGLTYAMQPERKNPRTLTYFIWG